MKKRNKSLDTRIILLFNSEKACGNVEHKASKIESGKLPGKVNQSESDDKCFLYCHSV